MRGVSEGRVSISGCDFDVCARQHLLSPLWRAQARVEEPVGLGSGGWAGSKSRWGWVLVGGLGRRAGGAGFWWVGWVEEPVGLGSGGWAGFWWAGLWWAGAWPVLKGRRLSSQ